MRIKSIAVSIVPGILILCIMAVVLIPGCSSPKKDSPPPLVTPATPAAIFTTTASPALTPGGTCRQGLTWCNGHCSDLLADIGDCGACGAPCPSGQTCLSGQCCRKGLALCNGTCSDLTADVKNCGSCGNVCPAEFICYNSKCLNMNIACPPGQTECYDEKCYDLTSDNMNCGYCGIVCPAYSGCIDSVCVPMDDAEVTNYVIHMPV